MNNTFSINQPNTIRQPRTTGRYIAVIRNFEQKQAKEKLEKKTSLSIASSGDYDEKTKAVSSRAFNEGANGLYLERLGVMVLDKTTDPTLIKKLEEDKEIVSIREEQVLYALHELNAQYMQGYYDAVRHLYEISQQRVTSTASQSTAQVPLVHDDGLWPLRMTGVLESRFSGQGVNLAVLDTGLDFDHPDFVNRDIKRFSAFPDLGATDGHGHGTHCAGIAAGPRQPTNGPRYGVAYNANLHVAKVLDDRGEGSDSTVVEGIEWAIGNNCKILSLSLGAPVTVNMPFLSDYEDIARRALTQGTMIVAAAGNDSNRLNGRVNPVNSPANCPSILSVGAIGRDEQLADFSCGSADIFTCGGSVDLVAPGVRIRSAFRRPDQYRELDGTSMATPFVAGIAALVAEAFPNRSALEFRNHLTRTARLLNVSRYDAGCGLVQA